MSGRVSSRGFRGDRGVGSSTVKNASPECNCICRGRDRKRKRGNETTCSFSFKGYFGVVSLSSNRPDIQLEWERDYEKLKTSFRQYTHSLSSAG